MRSQGKARCEDSGPWDISSSMKSEREGRGSKGDRAGAARDVGSHVRSSQKQGVRSYGLAT